MHPPNTKQNTILTNYTIYNTNMIHKLLHHHLKIAINMIHDYIYMYWQWMLSAVNWFSSTISAVSSGSC